jgi:hypothetical protein
LFGDIGKWIIFINFPSREQVHDAPGGAFGLIFLEVLEVIHEKAKYGSFCKKSLAIWDFGYIFVGTLFETLVGKVLRTAFGFPCHQASSITDPLPQASSSYAAARLVGDDVSSPSSQLCCNRKRLRGVD